MAKINPVIYVEGSFADHIGRRGLHALARFAASFASQPVDVLTHGPSKYHADLRVTEQPAGAHRGSDTILSALNEAESFIQGFDDDDAQEPGSIEKLLALVADAKNAMEGR